MTAPPGPILSDRGGVVTRSSPLATPGPGGYAPVMAASTGIAQGGSAPLLLALLLTVVWVAGGSAQVPDAPGVPGGAGADHRAAAHFHPVHFGLSHRMAIPEWDLGVGMVRIRPGPGGHAGQAPPDTLWIRAAPGEGAPPVALAFHHGYQLSLKAEREGLHDGAVEVAYEERALPVLDRAPDGRWLEVGYAFDDEGVSWTGWVDGEDPRVEYLTWSHWLQDWDTFYFVHPGEIAFHRTPEGARVPLSPVPGAGSWQFDYALYPIRIEGRWMEVRVVSPTDYCVRLDELPEEALDVTVWIEALDAGKRPRIWSWTRGC